ncbi:MAG TPA: sepiapterin reductase [Legionella sp.]|nr:sepiapterin reductase [Legionella sp.]
MYVVTGGGRGIGRALALALAARGQSVCILGRGEDDLMHVAALSPRIEYVCADVSIPEGRQRVKTHLHHAPVIHGLIHNAGIIEPIMPIGDVDELSWQHCMATHVDAPLFLTQLLLDKLTAGRVLNISSGAAHFPVAGWAAYCVSKAALSMLTQCWQLECPLTAFASVMPGIIDTEMQARIREAHHMNPDKRDFFKQLKQDHRLLSPETVAAFLCWLLLDLNTTHFGSKEWDIYDTHHHSAWLVPPHHVPALE